MDTWKELQWWDCGEQQVIKEKLDELDKSGATYCPGRDHLYAAMELCPYGNTHVVLMGQDPYPNPKLATGLAFDVPASVRKYPPSLQIIYDELQSDLQVERKNGSLRSWCKQGVFLWNAIPTCLAWKSLSHERWTEWTYLTKEIVEKLSERGIVFVFLGRVARQYAKYVDLRNNQILEYSHPSPMGLISKKQTFKGSRLFSTVNAKLVENGLSPIDWRL